MSPVNTIGKQKFIKGQSGNPKGRPKGSRNRTTLAVEALLQGEAQRLTRLAIKKALDGDIAALRLCLERISPPAKERAVTFAMPTITKVTDMPGAALNVIAAVSRGEVTPGEAETILKLLEAYRRSAETAEIEKRLEKLEMAHLKSN